MKDELKTIINDDLDSRIEDAFKQVENATKKIVQMEKPSFLTDYDMVNPYREKREKVVVDYIKEHYGPDYDSWLTNYIYLNFTFPSTYEMLEEDDFLTFAMALYMLDHIDHISDVRKLSVGCDLDDVNIPSFLPLKYRTDDVRSILYIIQHRNDDLGENERILLNAYSFQKSVPEVPSRARFHQLMKLVGHREEARAYYESKRQEWFDTFLEAIKAYANEIGKFTEKIENEFYENCFEPLPQYDFVSDFLEPNLSYKDREERKRQSLAMHEAFVAFPKLFSASAKSNVFAARLNDEYKWEQDKTPPGLIMREYQVEDPYFLAYGLLVLLDERDDSLFDYGVNIGMLNRAIIALPWHYNYEFNTIKEVDANDYFTKTYEYNDKKYPLNALVYDTCRYIVPRHIKSVKSKVRLRAKDQGFVDGFMTAIAHSTFQKQEDGHQIEEELVKAQRLNKKLREEVEKLKRESHSMSSRNKSYKEEYEKIKHDYDNLNNETARLREIIFHRDEEDLPEEKVNISFPYQVKEKVLVYGGHKSWHKNMKTLFEGPIEFMLSGQRPPHDYLRSFDVIFLQTDSIGHDDYYYLIDIVRRYDLNFHYFTMRGVKACAKELVDYEEER